jgi:hypothetical protein
MRGFFKISLEDNGSQSEGVDCVHLNRKKGK